VSIKFWPAVTKLKVPAFPVRMGTGFSDSEVWAAIFAGTTNAAKRSRQNTTRLDRALPCQRGLAVFLPRYSKRNPSYALSGIVFHGDAERNITEVTFVSLMVWE
jgi:hypothetical protein